MYHNTLFGKPEHNGVIYAPRALRRYWTLCLVLCVALAAMAGCAHDDTDPLQECIEAYSVLLQQEEAHFTTRTFEGESASALSASSESEYWISGDNWLYHHIPDGSQGYWFLCLDGERFSAQDAVNPLQWQTSDSTMTPPDSIPDLNFDQLHLESAEEEGTSLVVTFSLDDEALNDLTRSERKILFILSAENTLQELQIREKWSFPTDNGTTETIYYETVTDYHSFETGEILEEIQRTYQSTSNTDA